MPRKRHSPVSLIPGFVRVTHIRCLDCDLRGDLHMTGRPLHFRRGRISKCANCAGKGEIPVSGVDSLDPYVKKSSDTFAEKRKQKAELRRHSKGHP